MSNTLKKVFTSNLLKQKYLYQIPSNKSIQDQSLQKSIYIFPSNKSIHDQSLQTKEFMNHEKSFIKKVF